MGILLLPLLLGAAILSVICMVRVIQWTGKRELSWQAILLGLGIGLTSYGIVVLSFYLEGEMYVVAPFFRLLFVMFYLPFIISHVLKSSTERRVLTFVKAISLSVSLSGLVAILFYQRFFEINELLNIPVTH